MWGLGLGEDSDEGVEDVNMGRREERGEEKKSGVYKAV